MGMWMYTQFRRLTPREMREMPKQKTCLVCGGALLRTAERATSFPYPWLPNGYVCSKCNVGYLGVP